jgi:hypothetical protein
LVHLVNLVKQQKRHFQKSYDLVKRMASGDGGVASASREASRGNSAVAGASRIGDNSSSGGNRDVAAAACLLGRAVIRAVARVITAAAAASASVGGRGAGGDGSSLGGFGRNFDVTCGGIAV